MSRPLARAGLALLCLVAASCGGGPRAPYGTPAAGSGGDAALGIDFALPDLDGRVVRLSDFRGKVVLVNYFATWCQPCLGEIPALNGLVAEEGGLPGFAVVGISVDLQPDQVLRPFVEYMQIRYPVLKADDAMIRGRTPFGDVPAIPASFLIDPEGRVAETFVGLAPIEYIRKRAAELQD
jgi:peroxiredoxin